MEANNALIYSMRYYVFYIKSLRVEFPIESDSWTVKAALWPDSAQRKHLQRATHVDLQGNLLCLLCTEEISLSEEACDLVMITCSSGYCLSAPLGKAWRGYMKRNGSFCTEERQQQAEAWEERDCVAASSGCVRKFSPSMQPG